MTEKLSEKSDMLCVDFCQATLREKIAPPEFGSVKQRINRAARKLRWPVNRVRDIWYADPRVSIKAEELNRIEQVSGEFYGIRKQLEINRGIETTIAAYLEQDNPGVRRLLATALFRALGLGDLP